VLPLRLLLLSSLLAPAWLGCSSVAPRSAALIQPPEVVEVARRTYDYRPLDEVDIAYATDRDRGEVTPIKEWPYIDDRGERVWLGFAELQVNRKGPDKGQIHLKSVEETAVLEVTVGHHEDRSAFPDPQEEAAFYAAINQQLDQSETRDLVVFIPGFRTPFPDPLLVSGQFASLAGGAAVFMGYSWPSTPSLTAYFRDIETAEYSSRSLRLLLASLAANTTAKQIHLLGYSSGTRLVARTVHEIALETNANQARARQDYRLGHVVLVSSDMDRQLFGSFLADGIAEACEKLIVYRSDSDGVLGFASWLFTRERLGHIRPNEQLPELTLKYLREIDQLEVIDVSDAQLVASGNGHDYFLNSPWVSSDILLTLLTDMPPNQRGLVLGDDGYSWQFPADYADRLARLAD